MMANYSERGVVMLSIQVHEHVAVYIGLLLHFRNTGDKNVFYLTAWTDLVT